MFYTDTSRIDWKRFSPNIVDFVLNSGNDELVAITDGLRIVSFRTPGDYYSYSPVQLKYLPDRMSIISNALYLNIFPTDVAVINSDGAKYCQPYTAEVKIPEPEVVTVGGQLDWGVTDFHLYIKDKLNRTGWYREKVLDFHVESILLLNDSTAILWDGVKTNYIYSLQDHSYREYEWPAPLNDFLHTPLRSIDISSGSQGCFHSFSDNINYQKDTDSTFSTIGYHSTIPDRAIRDTDSLTISQSQQQDASYYPYKKNITAAAIIKILRDINSNPKSMPDICSFAIQDSDKANYLALVDTLIVHENLWNPFPLKKHRQFCRDILNSISTLEHGTIDSVFDKRVGLWSTTENWLVVEMVNSRNDTLIARSDCSEAPLAWHLPWLFIYKGYHFKVKNLDFSKFIKSCLPEIFFEKEYFDNKYLLLNIADYIYHTQKR